MSSSEDVPLEVLLAYGIERCALEPIATGLINKTYRVLREGAPIMVLQRLHPIFSGEVNLDIDAITEHLAGAGLTTPRVIRARSGSLWVDFEGCWRALTYLSGRTFDAFPGAEAARSAGSLVGRFIAALDRIEHHFHFGRAGVHDTAGFLTRLRNAIAGTGAAADAARSIGQTILSRAAALPRLEPTRKRIVHGDLKTSNILFHPERDEAIALIDLDTLAYGTIAYELGDALRSWCNPGSESTEHARIDVAYFAASISGLAERARSVLAPAERAQIVPGTELVALELAARFALDAVEDHYFGWDPRRYPSRRAHNLARATSQLSLSDSIRAVRGELDEIVGRELPS